MISVPPHAPFDRLPQGPAPSATEFTTDAADQFARPDTDSAAEPLAEAPAEELTHPQTDTAREKAAEEAVQWRTDPVVGKAAEEAVGRESDPVVDTAAEESVRREFDTGAEPAAEATEASTEAFAQPETDSVVDKAAEESVRPETDPAAEPAAEASTEQFAEPESDTTVDPSAEAPAVRKEDQVPTATDAGPDPTGDEQPPGDLDSRDGQPPSDLDSRDGQPPSDLDSRDGQPPSDLAPGDVPRSGDLDSRPAAPDPTAAPDMPPHSEAPEPVAPTTIPSAFGPEPGSEADLSDEGDESTTGQVDLVVLDARRAADISDGADASGEVDAGPSAPPSALGAGLDEQWAVGVDRGGTDLSDGVPGDSGGLAATGDPAAGMDHPAGANGAEVDLSTAREVDAADQLTLGGVAEDDLPADELADPERLRSALEAVLLVVDVPTSSTLLAQVLQRSVHEIETALRELRDDYDATGRGLDLREVADGWRLYSRDEFSGYVERIILDGQQARLTQAALETLAVIAYRQPVTRSRISGIRGVSVDAVMRTLLTRGLVEECGADPDTGGGLYRTTRLFLEKLGLRSLDELPSLAPLLPDTSQLDDVAVST